MLLLLLLLWASSAATAAPTMCHGTGNGVAAFEAQEIWTSGLCQDAGLKTLLVAVQPLVDGDLR